jgi:hypothetical protein
MEIIKIVTGICAVAQHSSFFVGRLKLGSSAEASFPMQKRHR